MVPALMRASSFQLCTAMHTSTQAQQRRHPHVLRRSPSPHCMSYCAGIYVHVNVGGLRTWCHRHLPRISSVCCKFILCETSAAL